jgi:hypothetical protein
LFTAKCLFPSNEERENAHNQVEYLVKQIGNALSFAQRREESGLYTSNKTVLKSFSKNDKMPSMSDIEIHEQNINTKRAEKSA